MSLRLARLYVDPCFRDRIAFVFQSGSHDELVAMLFADYESLARAVVGPSCFHAKPPAPAWRSRMRGTAATA